MSPTIMSQSSVTSILFIDAAVQDIVVLTANVKPGVQVYILQAHQDGIEQITAVLHNLRANGQYQEVHIVAHGLPGAIFLGNAELSLDTLDRYTHDLKAWFTPKSKIQNLKSPTPQLNLYACNVAAGDAGAEFIAKLHKLTGSPIAASTTRVGSQHLGGNWALDVKTHEFTISCPLTSEVLESYQSVLPLNIDTLIASYESLTDAPSENYTQTGTDFDNYNFRTNATEDNLVITGFTASSGSFSFVQLADQINIQRVNNAGTDYERDLFWYEDDTTSGRTLNLKPQRAFSLEEALRSDIINRGADNVFVNTTSEVNTNNIERIDFVVTTGLSAPTANLSDTGFLVMERGGNDNVKIAAITGIDEFGQPTAYGSLNTVNTGAWGASSFAFSTSVLNELTDGNNPTETSRVSTQTINGFYESFADLGITGDQTFYGYSIFPGDVNTTDHTLTDVSTFPTTTAGSDGGLDLVAGGALYVRDGSNIPPTLNLDLLNTTGGADDKNYQATSANGAITNIADPNNSSGFDPNNAGNDIETLTITFSGVADGANEVLTIGGQALALTNGSSITAAVGGTTFSALVSGTTITITNQASGAIPDADISALLKDIKYSNSSPSAGARVFNLTASDGDGPGNTVTSTISVNVTNLLPSPVDDAITVDEDSDDNVIDVLANDVDLGDGLGSIALKDDATKGTVTLADQGNADPSDDVFTYTPDDNYAGADSFTYTLTDANGDPSTATVNITVTPVNDAPAFSNLDATPTFTEGGSAVVLDADATLSDEELDAVDNWDGATLTLERNGGANSNDVFTVPSSSIGSVTTNANGTLVFTFNNTATSAGVDGLLQSIQYSNSAPSSSSVTLDYTINDGNGADPGGAQGTGGPLTGTGSLDVTINRLPTASDDAATVDEDSEDNTIDVLLNDVDLGDGLGSIVLETDATNGTVTLDDQDNADPSDDVFTYTPDENYSGADSFTYTLTDANGDPSTATVNITVTPINDAPTFTSLDGSETYTEDGSAVVLDSDATLNDIDLSAFNSNNGNWAGASLTIERQGGASPEDVFGTTGTLAVLTEGNALVVAGTTVGTVTTNSGGTLELSFDSNATNALVDQVLQQITYSNSNDEPPTSVTLDYTISDGNDGNQGKNPGTGAEEPLTGTASKTITITPQNDKPVITPGDSLTYTENTPAAVIDAAVTLSDPDDTEIASGSVTISGGFTTGDALAVDTSATNITANYDTNTGVLTLTGTDTLANYQTVMRAVTYVSSSDDPTESSATRTITWSVTDADSDGAGAATSDAVTSTITVIPLNDPPVLDLDEDDSAEAASGDKDYQALFTPGSGAVAIADSDTAIADLDDTNITSATITLTTRPDGSEEELVITQAILDGINGDITIGSNYDPATGVLVLTGSAPLDDYEVAIAAITYNNADVVPDRSDRTITVVVQDAGGNTGTGSNSNTATTTIRFDSDGDGVADSDDLDDDNDGILDTVELGGDPTLDTDGDGLINSLDIDSDDDGIVDVIEAGGEDPDGDGRIGAGPITDVDEDGLDDSVDNVNSGNPTNEVTEGTPLVTPNSDGDGNPDYLDIDADDDGIPDNVEAQPTEGYVAPLGEDSDGDGLDNAYDPDADGSTPLTTLEDTDADDTPDYLDEDSDNDGLDDLQENGFEADTPSGTDTDGDGLDDAFEGDNPNDPFDPNDEIDTPATDLPDTDEDVSEDGGDVDYRDVTDTDGDGVPDPIDLDDDNDGILDTVELGDGLDPDLDTDGDGRFDWQDPDAPGFVDANGDGVGDRYDFDGDGIPNHLDIDSDDDGIVDVLEAGGTDEDGDGRIDPLGDGIDDADNDGVIDRVDSDESGTPLTPANTDETGNPDYLDIDADDDGIPDNVEAQPTEDYVAPSGADSDKDGLDDAYDPDAADSTPLPIDALEDTDADDTPDYLDEDSDNDGLDDLQENGFEADTPSGTDTDGDGLDDAFEGDNPNDPFDPNDEIDTPATDLPDTDEDVKEDGGDVDYRDFTDTDGDGVPDPIDLDDDNDGILDTVELGDGLDPDLDTDGDGRFDWQDPDAPGFVD
ncbi:MAG: DUF4347 domain-containing protein, partial [Leptolyngbyaceae cyanobacterium]